MTDVDGADDGSAPLFGAVRAVAREILVHGPRSRTELAARLSLSPGSLTRLTKPLIDRGLLAEGSAVRGSSMQGPPLRPLSIVPDAVHLVGVKLTSDEAYAVLVDLEAKILSTRQTFLTDKDPAAVCAVIAGMVAQFATQSAVIRAIGISFGGHSSNRVDVTATYLGWREVPLATLVEQATSLPCVVDNDVIALTEAQHWFGSGRGHERFAVLTIGAGIGYALVVHDRILRSRDTVVGVFGHFIIDPSGPPCPDGHRGCAASYLRSDSVTAAVSVGLRRVVGYEEALDLSEGGNPIARMVTDEAGRALGRLVAGIAELALTDRVILSGEGIRLAKVAEPAVQAGLAQSRPVRVEPVVIDIQEIDFHEWARGAAVIAMQRFVIGDD